MLYRAQRDKCIKIGVGSGGNQWGKDNHRWKDVKNSIYKGSYRSRCFKTWEKKCVIDNNCEGSIQVHHIDGNCINLHDDNLKPLCHKHHWMIHAKRGLTSEQLRYKLCHILVENGRSKIAEKIGNPETGIRPEG
jgi:hypothetical protein